MKFDNTKNIVIVVMIAASIWAMMAIESEENKQITSDERNSFELLDDTVGDDNKVNREVFEDKLTLGTFGSDQNTTAKVSDTTTPGNPSESKGEGNATPPSEPETKTGSLWGASSPSATKNTSSTTIPPTTAPPPTNNNTNPQPTTQPKEIVRVVYVERGKPNNTHPPEPSPRPKRGQFSMSDYLADNTASSAQKLVGSNNFAEGKLLKNGSKYWGIIEEPMRIIDGEPQHVEIMILGKLSPHSISIPFLLTGKATLNKDKSRIKIEVTDCIDPRSKARSVKCKGVIRDSEGYDGIGGVTASPWYRAFAVRLISKIFSGMLIADLTRSVTENGTLIDQTNSNRLMQGLAEGTETGGEEAAKRMESSGDSITVNGPSIVKIRIIEDTELW